MNSASTASIRRGMSRGGPICGVLARTDRPYIKEYDEETNLRCVLMLDCSGSMAYGGQGGRQSKFDYAVKLVAALAYLMLSHTESVGLAQCGARVEQWLAPRAGTAQLSRIIDVVERVSPRSGQANLAPKHAAGRRPAGKAVAGHRHHRWIRPRL